jgi:hypothetical protein
MKSAEGFVPVSLWPWITRLRNTYRSAWDGLCQADRPPLWIRVDSSQDLRYTWIRCGPVVFKVRWVETDASELALGLAEQLAPAAPPNARRRCPCVPSHTRRHPQTDCPSNEPGRSH